MNNPIDSTIRELADGGCCAGTGAATPQPITNRAGLPEIAFRPGRHADFKASLLAALSASGAPAFAGLQTRENDDFTIALLDGWASIAEVLSFYSERIANEAYLGTATERRSVLELARAIGYELAPGVASAADLAFTIEDAPGAPGFAQITRPTQVQSLPGPGEKPQTFETIDPERRGEYVVGKAEWNEMRALSTRAFDPKMDLVVPLEGGETNLKLGDGILFVRGKSAVFRRVKSVALKIGDSPVKTITLATFDESLAGETEFQNAGGEPEVFAFRQRGALFGSNAPMTHAFESLAKFKELIDEANHRWNNFSIHRVDDKDATAAIHLDSTYQQLSTGQWLAFEGENVTTPTVVAPGASAEPTTSFSRQAYVIQRVTEAAPAKFTLSNRVSKLTLEAAKFSDANQWQLRETTLFLQPEKLRLGKTPSADADTDTIGQCDSRTASTNEIVLDRVVSIPPAGRRFLVVGVSPDGNTRGEIVEMAAPADLAAKTTDTLSFTKPLTNCYRRKTVRIFGNVVSATHGETVLNEVLGSGDAAVPHQRFTLRQAPLTFVPADNETHSASTLEVRVNGVLWREVPSFYQRKADERVYVARRDDDGRVTVIFGDGKHGARVPTGRENVVATYRKGSGHEGQVNAEQLTLLMTRALGVRSVTNPLPSSPAVDPESRDFARARAPRRVLTLGRVVSVRDYEDFARNFLGIGKAQAVWTWDPPTRGVFLTLAPPAENVSPDKATPDDLRKDMEKIFTSLQSTIEKKGNARIPLRWNVCRWKLFDVQGTVFVAPGLEKEKVLARVKARLRERFGFAARELGQSLALSEVVGAIHAVPGVKHVNIQQFGIKVNQRSEDPVFLASPGAPVPKSVEDFLRAQRAADGADFNRLVDPKDPPTDLITLGPDALALLVAAFEEVAP